MLSRHRVDCILLHPLLGTCRQQLAEAGICPKLRTVLADSGYVSEENFFRAIATHIPSITTEVCHLRGGSREAQRVSVVLRPDRYSFGSEEAA
jgi:hypothetical protein